MNPFFLVAVLLASLNQFLEYNGIFIPFIHCYLDDLLCFPIVLTLGLAAYRAVWPNYTLGFWHMAPLFIIYSVYFELYLPQLSSNYTADFVDVLMYLAGLALFSHFINQRDSIAVDSRSGL